MRRIEKGYDNILRQNEKETSKDLRNTLASLLKKDFLNEMYECNYVKNCKNCKKNISMR
jgi:hypothetical protein